MELLERGRTILSQQPFSVLLGAELANFGGGLAELALSLRAEHRQQHGFVHGGVLAYLADNALTFAAGSVFGDALTLEMKINYTRPAVGTRVIARARVVHAGKRQAVVRCDVFDVSDETGERVCAVAQGTVSRVEPRP